MDSDDQSPQIKGVVIISLPPPDNPSLGKTITAFTYTEPQSQSPSLQSQPQQQNFHNNSQSSSDHDNNNDFHSNPSSSPELQFSFRKLFFGTPTKIFTFFSVLLFALFLYGSFSSNTLQELSGLRNNDDHDDGPNSFLFPLFPKIGVHGQKDLRLKVRNFVDTQKENFVVTQRKADVYPKVADSSSVFPISGNIFPDGLYYTYLQVGNPPKRYFLDVDTGSDLTWIQCDAPCRSCAKGAHVPYKPVRSNIVPSVDSICFEVQKNQRNEYQGSLQQQCDYEIQYADHSSSLGVLIRDDVHLLTTNGSKAKLNFVFGCGYDQDGSLLNTLAKTDGIMGLSRAKVSLPFQLASKGLIKNVVGHCLSKDGVGGGYMFLGDDFVPYWGMTWAPMANTDLYQAEILGMNYGYRPLSFDGNSKVGKVIFDSGSSYTYFPKVAFLDLVASLEEVSGLGLVQDESDKTLPICWQANFPIRSVKDVKNVFDTLSLRFGSKWWILSTVFQIPPEGYLIISKKGNVCLAILDGSNVHDGSTIILGDISLRGYMVVYDNVNKKIGWERAECGMPRRIRKNQNLLTDSML
ncbi:aspartyl protease APCB1 [Arachis stenosperma]|uniref:aspartyl protease APCB1 n=1 Tax=Arachis stenosperma TaxID=217475 RepID=UPI0025AB8AD4|nr:aspartyl protease APCB1 [Arachis stenosperma]